MSSARLNRSPAGPIEAGGGIDRTVLTPPSSIPLKVPYIDGALINYLLQTFPAHVKEEYDLREYDRQVGVKRVLDHLKALEQDQQG